MLICRETDALTDGRTDNIYSIFRDKLLLLREHVFYDIILWRFTRMQLADISMPTVYFTVFVCVITVLECTPTLSECAMPVQVVLLQTLPKANCPNWYTRSPSRCHFWFFLLMLILKGSILALIVPRFTSSHAVACQDLHPHENSIALWILPHSCSGQGQQILRCLPQSPQPPAHQLPCSIRQQP